MCQILSLMAGASIPTNMLERTCDINKDGFGFVVRNKGKFVIERDITTNDPKRIGALLDKWKEKPRYLHLRHTTVGAITMGNNHPFVVLEDRGPQLLMMHNGTLREYEPVKDDKVTSDTFLFNQEFVRPLAERVWAYSKGKTSPLRDPIFRRAFVKEVGSGWSVFLLLDNFGEQFRINPSQGKEYDWGWASNEYSFNDNHFRSSAKPTQTYHSRTDYEDVSHLWQGQGYADVTGREDPLPWEEFTPPAEAKEISSGWTKYGSKSAAASAAVFEKAHKALDLSGDRQQLQYEIDEFAAVLKRKQFREDKRDLPMSETTIRSLKKARDTFLKMAGLEDFEGLANLSKGDLTELSDEFPKATAELVIDMFTEIKKIRLNNDIQAKTIIGLANDRGKEKAAASG